MLSRSACAPGRGSFDGSTYAAGPAVRGEILERDQQSRLLVVVVVAQRPLDPRQRRVLAPPGALRLARRERALERFGGAAIAESLVQPADAVVRGRHEHQVAGR